MSTNKQTNKHEKSLFAMNVPFVLGWLANVGALTRKRRNLDLKLVDPPSDKHPHRLAMPQYKGMHHSLLAQDALHLRELVLHLIIILNRAPLIRLAVVKHKLATVLLNQCRVHLGNLLHFLPRQE